MARKPLKYMKQRDIFLRDFYNLKYKLVKTFALAISVPLTVGILGALGGTRILWQTLQIDIAAPSPWIQLAPTFFLFVVIIISISTNFILMFRD